MATSELGEVSDDTKSIDLRWFTQGELHRLGPDMIHKNTQQVYDFTFEYALKHWCQTNTTLFKI